MRKTPVYRYYWFGTCVRYLQDARRGYRIHGQGRVLYTLNEFFEYLDALELVVTKRTCGELFEFKTSLAMAADEAKMTDEHANKLRSLMSDVRRTLDAEIEGFEAFVITPKRLDVQKLLDDVPALLAPGVFEKLPDVARHDLLEAAKCIAFERPTAAAFHVLRGTESVLRHFYCSLITRKRVKDLAWSPMLADLRRKKRTRKHVALYNNLDNIPLSFRSPARDPDLFYDLHEAQDLWSLCCDSINRMMKQLASGKPVIPMRNAG